MIERHDARTYDCSQSIKQHLFLKKLKNEEDHFIIHCVSIACCSLIFASSYKSV